MVQIGNFVTSVMNGAREIQFGRDMFWPDPLNLFDMQHLIVMPMSRQFAIMRILQVVHCEVFKKEYK